MKKITLITLSAIFLVIIMLSFVLYKTISGYSISVEKCNSMNTDDCWHSLAHQTFNREYCLKIADNETREHCLEHIPEINKENK